MVASNASANAHATTSICWRVGGATVRRRLDASAIRPRSGIRKPKNATKNRTSVWKTRMEPTAAGPSLELTDVPLSLIADNLLLLRTVEYRAELHRVFSVLKMRFSAHEPAIYEYSVDDGQGIGCSDPMKTISQSLLRGVGGLLAHQWLGSLGSGRPMSRTTSSSSCLRSNGLRRMASGVAISATVGLAEVMTTTGGAADPDSAAAWRTAAARPAPPR